MTLPARPVAPLALTLALVLSACGRPTTSPTTTNPTTNPTTTNPTTNPTNPTGTGFSGYVALGDSLTAGMQSGGLTAATQRAAYPVVLSLLAGAPIKAPEGQDPGCPPPFGAAPGPGSCQRLNPSATVGVFAIPGARVEDLATITAANASAETRGSYRLALGDTDTQVSAARKAAPRFLSVWIGANNVLNAALEGDPAQATPPAQFEAAYANVLNALSGSGAQIVLFTVPDVTNIPALVTGQKLFEEGFGDASCQGSTTRYSAALLLNGIFTGTRVACATSPGLTPAESATLEGTVNAYNAAINRLAAARGYAVYDVATLIESFDTRTFNPRTIASLFGPDFSLDGIHPNDFGQAKIARGFAAFLNARFGTTIPTR